MGNLQYFWKSKWGISDRTKTRLSQVDKSTPGDVYTILKTQIPFAWQVEQFVHSLYKITNAPFTGKDGGSEWFLNINFLVGGAFLYIFKYKGYEILVSENGIDLRVYALMIWSPWIWLDGLFWLIFFWMFWVLVAIAGLIFFVHLYQSGFYE